MSLDLETSCNLIVKSVRNSCLNFSMQETPFSLYLTIRKTFAKNTHEAPTLQPLATKLENDTFLKDEIKQLEVKLSEAESMNQRLKCECEELSNNSEEKHKQLQILEAKFSNHKDDKIKLGSELESVEKKWKVLHKEVREKNKQNYELKKENEFILDDLTKLKSNFATLSATVNKEKMKEEKKQKKKESKEFLDNLKTDSADFTFQCCLCDLKKESQLDLQNHVRFMHMKSSSAHTNEIVTEDKNLETSEAEFNSKECQKYQCFYCDREIVSEKNMLDHRQICHGASEYPSLFSLPVRCPPVPVSLTQQSKCVGCGWTGQCETDLKNHMKIAHIKPEQPF